jgi:hypothetical protein
MAERVGIRSRAHALPLRGPAPSCLPTQGSISPAIPLVRIPPRPFAMAIPTHTPSQPCMALFDGGEGGIRTHGPVAETHAFQACRFVHSRTSPRSDDFKGTHLITQVLVRQGKPEPANMTRAMVKGSRPRSGAPRGPVATAPGVPPLTTPARIPILRDYFSGGT